MIILDNMVRAVSADVFAQMMRDDAERVQENITATGLMMGVANPILNGIADGCDNDASETRSLLLRSAEESTEEERLRAMDKAVRDMLLSAAIAGFVMGATAHFGAERANAAIDAVNPHGSHGSHAPDGE